MSGKRARGWRALVVGIVGLSFVVSPALAVSHPTPSAYGHAFWNPPLKSGSYDELARFVARAFRNESVAVTAWDGQSTMDLQPQGPRAFEVHVRTLSGENESFVQQYQVSHDPRGGVWIRVPYDRFHPTIDVPRSGPGSEVVLLGPPGSIPLNGTNVTEKARAFASMMGFDPAQVHLYAGNRSGVERAPSPGWHYIYAGNRVCPSSDSQLCRYFDGIVFDASNCTNAVIKVGQDNSTEWYEARFHVRPWIDGRGPAVASMYFCGGELVYASLDPGYQLNVTNMIGPQEARNDLRTYFALRGYGMNDRDFLGLGVEPAPMDGRVFTVNSTVYGSFGIRLYNLTLAHEIFGDQPVPPLIGNENPAWIPDPKLRELYTKTDLRVVVYQDTVTGEVTNITYSHWANASGLAHLGGGPGPWNIPSIGLPGLATAMAVALLAFRRRRGG